MKYMSQSQIFCETIPETHPQRFSQEPLLAGSGGGRAFGSLALLEGRVKGGGIDAPDGTGGTGWADDLAAGTCSRLSDGLLLNRSRLCGQTHKDAARWCWPSPTGANQHTPAECVS